MTKMDDKTIQIISFTGEKEKWCIWLGKFMKGSGIKGYHVLLLFVFRSPGRKACPNYEAVWA